MADLISDLRRCQSETSQLKSSLNNLGKEKEEWFGKASLLKKEIASAVEKIQECKSKRDLLTGSVKQKKSELKVLDDSLRELLSKRSVVSKDSASKVKAEISPSRLKAEIEHMETRIETEGISFNEEQKIMKLLKQKKKVLEALKKQNLVSEEIKAVNSSLSDLRDSISDLRGKIKVEAAESQKFHEEMISAIKLLGDLKSKKKECFEKCVELKKSFSEANSKLKEKLAELANLKSRLDNDHALASQEKAERNARFLEQKELELKEKILKGKKLTTQDLLIFQSKELGN